MYIDDGNSCKCDSGADGNVSLSAEVVHVFCYASQVFAAARGRFSEPTATSLKKMASTCPSCQVPYDLDDHCATVLLCYHTCCSSCLYDICVLQILDLPCNFAVTSAGQAGGPMDRSPALIAECRQQWIRCLNWQKITSPSQSRGLLWEARRKRSANAQTRYSISNLG
jgi:hypothetical protein